MTTNYLRILQHFSRVGILFAHFFLQVTGGESLATPRRGPWIRSPCVSWFGIGGHLLFLVKGHLQYPKKGAPAELPMLVLRHFCLFCFWRLLNNLGEYIPCFVLFFGGANIL